MLKFWLLGILGMAAVIEDVSSRRISNWIPLCALLSGLGYQIWQNSWRGALFALLGSLAGSAVFLVFYLLGGMGGGDIKLMAGFGAILGANGILIASLWTAAFGGVMAAFVIGWNAARRALAGRSGSFCARPGIESIPYAPAIAFGVWLSGLQAL